MFFSPIPDFPQLPTFTPETDLSQLQTPIAVLTWDQNDEAFMLQLGQRLGSRLVVPEVWRNILPQAGLLISSAISGGTLQERFEEAARLSPRRCWLLLEPLQMEFPLPCPTGVGYSADIPEASPVFFSQPLCCQYTHFIRSGTGFMLLWDTEETLHQKMSLAKACGFLGYVCAENM